MAELAARIGEDGGFMSTRHRAEGKSGEHEVKRFVSMVTHSAQA